MSFMPDPYKNFKFLLWIMGFLFYVIFQIHIAIRLLGG